MARINNLNNFLTDVADAIRAKTGGTAPIDAEDFDTEIASISGDVKLFSSTNEMLADTSEEDGTYGLVYYNITKNATEGDVSSTIMLPRTVVLPTAMTSEESMMINEQGSGWVSIDYYITSSDTYFDIQYEDSNGTHSFNIQYTSQDGITYTTEDTEHTNVEIELPMNVTMENRYGDFADSFSYFVQLVIPHLDGVYEYTNRYNKEWFNVATNIVADIENKALSATKTQTWLPKLAILLNSMESNKVFDSDDNAGEYSPEYIVVKSGNDYYIQETTGIQYPVYDSNTSKLYYGCNSVSSVYKLYRLSLDTISYEYLGEYNKDFIYDTYKAMSPYNNGDVVYCSKSIYWPSLLDNGTFTSGYFRTLDLGMDNATLTTWHHLQSDINLIGPEQLSFGITGLGQYGPVTGNGDILKHINWIEMTQQYRDSINALACKSNMNGHSVSVLPELTNTSIMQDNFELRVLKDAEISETDLYNDKPTITESHIILCNRPNPSDWSKWNWYIYDYDGNLLCTIENSSLVAYRCQIHDIDTNTLGIVTYNNGIYFYRLNLSTGEMTNTKSYTDSKYKGSVYQYWSNYDSVNDELLCFHLVRYNSSNQKNYVHSIFENHDYGTVDTSFAFYQYANQYTLTPGILEDNNYYYVSSLNNDSAHSFMALVFDKSTKQYVGIINDFSGSGGLILNDTLGEIWAGCGKNVYKLNGTSKTLLQTVSVSITSGGYIVYDNNGIAYAVVNGYIINLSTGDYSKHIYADSNSGFPHYMYKNVLATYRNIAYLYMHKHDMLLSITGDNILLECEHNAVTNGYSHYITVSNTAITDFETYNNSLDLTNEILGEEVE